jgi:hypothetical protein
MAPAGPEVRKDHQRRQPPLQASRDEARGRGSFSPLFQRWGLRESQRNTKWVTAFQPLALLPLAAFPPASPDCPPRPDPGCRSFHKRMCLLEWCIDSFSGGSWSGETCKSEWIAVRGPLRGAQSCPAWPEHLAQQEMWGP